MSKQQEGAMPELEENKMQLCGDDKERIVELVAGNQVNSVPHIYKLKFPIGVKKMSEPDDDVPTTSGRQVKKRGFVAIAARGKQTFTPIKIRCMKSVHADVQADELLPELIDRKPVSPTLPATSTTNKTT